MIRSNQARVAVSVDRSWEDATLSVAERVEELMRRMTLAEKVAQLGSRWVGVAPVELGADEGSDAGGVARSDPECRTDAGRVRRSAGRPHWRRRAGTASGI